MFSFKQPLLNNSDPKIIIELTFELAGTKKKESLILEPAELQTESFKKLFIVLKVLEALGQELIFKNLNLIENHHLLFCEHPQYAGIFYRVSKLSFFYQEIFKTEIKLKVDLSQEINQAVEAARRVCKD